MIVTVMRSLCSGVHVFVVATLLRVRVIHSSPYDYERSSDDGRGVWESWENNGDKISLGGRLPVVVKPTLRDKTNTLRPDICYV